MTIEREDLAKPILHRRLGGLIAATRQRRSHFGLILTLSLTLLVSYGMLDAYSEVKPPVGHRSGKSTAAQNRKADSREIQNPDESANDLANSEESFPEPKPAAHAKGSGSVKKTTGSVPVARRVVGQVRQKDTLGSFLKRHNVPSATVLAVAGDSKGVYPLSRRLDVGDKIELGFDQQQHLVSLVYQVDKNRWLQLIAKDNGHFTAKMNGEKPEGTDLTLNDAGSDPAARQDGTAVAPPEVKPTAIITEQLASAAPLPVVRNSSEAKHSVPNGTKSAAIPATDSDDDGIPAPKSLVEATNDPGFDLKIHSLHRHGGAAANVVEEKIRNGDDLVDLLARRKVSPNTSLAVAKAAKPVFDLARQLQPGKILRMAFAEDGKLLGLSYPMDTDRDFWITRNTLVVKEEDTTSFVPQIQTKTMEVKTKTISGVIKSSLFEDGRKAGISQSMVVRMASLLEYDVDFARDIQTGDRFTVVFEEKYHQGKAVRDGEILAVEFINQGKAHQVFRYTDATGTVGYFGRDGNNIKKMFIRAPVDFVRITSTFSTSRMHPILGYSRAHKGVDYGAPTGTPVRAAADGKIVAMGFDSGYGNKVMIKHNNKYSTAYAHLSRFNTAFKVGSSVRQGQTIGLVGTTGMSTGPHLHYEILVNNEQVNPLSVQMASSEGIQKKYMNDFQKSITSMMAKLGSSGENAVASAKPVSKKGRTVHR